ncbi:MAG: cell wall-binding repeat-containing protein [Lachnospiraceae bacterium]|nr:cell wall-binding repeat-containing protein [Lachnospiraceae bacterium]
MPLSKRIKKGPFFRKWGVLLLTVCLLTALLPVSIFAEEIAYDLWVNNEQITSNHLTVACGEGTATYDPIINTLVLKNATISNGCDVDGLGCGILSRIDGLTIDVYDLSTITIKRGAGISTADYDDFGQIVPHELIIQGYNMLTIDTFTPEKGIGIYCTGNLLIRKLALMVRSEATAIESEYGVRLTDAASVIFSAKAADYTAAEGTIKDSGYAVFSHNGTIAFDYATIRAVSECRSAFMTGDALDVNMIELSDVMISEGTLTGNRVVIDRASMDEKRLGGANRYETAAKIADEAFCHYGSEEIILVDGAKFPDALAASAYAGAKDAAILISSLKSLKPEIKKLITENWTGVVKKVTLIGGGFEQQVIDDLKACGIDEKNIVTIAGKDRYETAKLIFEAGNRDGILTYDSCVVATGAKAADALSIAGWCYRQKMPLFLAGGATKTLRADVLAHVKKFNKIYIVGAESVVNDPALNELAATTDKVERLAGKNRYETSVAIARKFASPYGYGTIVFAAGTDENFPDALIGGTLAGKIMCPTLLVSRNDANNKPVYDYLREVYSHFAYHDVYYLGDERVVTNDTVTKMKAIMNENKILS